MDWLNAAVQGILLGGLYALFAVGLSLVFGTMRLTNLAHGDLTILPAYVALMIVNALNFNPFYSIPITMVIMFIVGYLLQRGLLNFVVGKGDVAGVIVTFGLSIVIQNALLLAFTANSQGLDAGKIENLSIKINDRLGRRLAAAHHLPHGPGGHHRAAGLHEPHQDGARLPGRLRRPGSRSA